MINLLHPDVFATSRPPRDRRRRRRCRTRVEWLEHRTLLAGAGDGILAGIATPSALGIPTTGSLAAGETVFYQVDPIIEGTLVAELQSGNDAVRLALLNGQDRVLEQGDVPSPANPDVLVDLDVSAGPEYLEVENLGAASTYTLTASFMAASTRSGPIAMSVADNPAALVTGDFTGNGRTDLAVVNSRSDDVSVLLGNGDGTFQPQVAYAVGSEPSALVAGDFNGDGRADLAVINAGSNDVSVLLGNGDGTFQPQVTYAVGDSPIALVAGDLTGDGRADLAVANEGSNDVSILLGNGDGTFQPQRIDAVDSFPTALVTGDFTDNGRTDLAVVDSRSDDVSVLLGNGDGTFQPQVAYAVGSEPSALVAGDFNGGGRADLAVVDAGSNDVSVLLGNGDGTFQSQATHAVGDTPIALVSGDFNGDGRADLAVANEGSNDVSILLGNGDGTFQPQRIDAVDSFPTALVTGDFTDNGRTDLAVVNSRSGDVSVLLGRGNGKFLPQVTYAVGNPTGAHVSGNVPGEVRTDLTTAEEPSNALSEPTSFSEPFTDPGPSASLPPPPPNLLSPGGPLGPPVVLNPTSNSPSGGNAPVMGQGPGLGFMGGVSGVEAGALGLGNIDNGHGTLAVEPVNDQHGLAETLSTFDLPARRGPGLSASTGGEVGSSAINDPLDAGSLLAYFLIGSSVAGSPVPGSSGATTEAAAQLVALSETSLALVGTLLITALNAPLVSVLSNAPGATVASVTENQAEVNTSFLSAVPSQGQGRSQPLNTGESGGVEAVETDTETSVGRGQGQGAGAPPWVRSVLGVDELIQQLHQENHDAFFGDEASAATGKSAEGDLGDPVSLVFPSVAIPPANEPAPGPSLGERSPHVACGATQLIDAAMSSLWASTPTGAPSIAAMNTFDAADEVGLQSPKPVPVWVPLALSATLVIRTSSLAEGLRDRRHGVESSTDRKKLRLNGTNKKGVRKDRMP